VDPVMGDTSADAAATVGFGHSWSQQQRIVPNPYPAQHHTGTLTSSANTSKYGCSTLGGGFSSLPYRNTITAGWIRSRFTWVRI
jgi:hypothetical protein